ncbi:MAG: hypothetical protein PHX83_01860 [Acidobacteriia bacterium]|nr:hypothetical protein [Terriglobia bacterium]
MRNTLMITTILATVLTLSTARPAYAGALKSAQDCVLGKRVVTSDGHKGKITRVDRAWSYCYVLQDDTGKEVSYLYSLLQTDDANSPKSDHNDKLVIGKYNCWVGTEGAASGFQVTGPSTYESDGKKGTYQLEPSGKIVFKSGPFSTFHAKLLSDRRVGLNMTGGTFYNMTCDPPK